MKWNSLKPKCPWIRKCAVRFRKCSSKPAALRRPVRPGRMRNYSLFERMVISAIRGWSEFGISRSCVGGFGLSLTCCSTLVCAHGFVEWRQGQLWRNRGVLQWRFLNFVCSSCSSFQEGYFSMTGFGETGSPLRARLRLQWCPPTI